MFPSTTWAVPWFPSSRAQWLSIQRIFWTGSSSRDVTNTGRSWARNASSAIRADRLAERIDANVAVASTSVPTAVAKDAIVAQSVEASTTKNLRSRVREFRPATRTIGLADSDHACPCLRPVH